MWPSLTKGTSNNSQRSVKPNSHQFLFLVYLKIYGFIWYAKTVHLWYRVIHLGLVMKINLNFHVVTFVWGVIVCSDICMYMYFVIIVILQAFIGYFLEMESMDQKTYIIIIIVTQPVVNTFSWNLCHCILHRNPSMLIKSRVITFFRAGHTIFD